MRRLVPLLALIALATASATSRAAAPDDLKPGEADAHGGAPGQLKPKEPELELGKAMGVKPGTGTIRVKRPDSATFVELTAGEAIPVGTVVDATQGRVELSSALPDGTSQAGTFSGARFLVRQSATTGMTDLVMRGGGFAKCRRTVATASARPRPVRRLWGRDHGGRFRTHGRESVATVRGTEWITEDYCTGTRTVVREGAVSVRVKRTGRTKLVRAGQSFLTRAGG